MDKRLKKIADNYGYESQSRQLIEEMAELTQAINKYWRWQHGYHIGPGTPVWDLVNEERDMNEELVDNIAAEIVDVEICLKQIKYLLNPDKEWLKCVKKSMINRQLKRMEEEHEME